MLLKDKLEPYRLLLASQSPRRRELMTGCGLPYEPAPKYECEEIYPDSLPAEEVPLFLSRLKSEAYPAPLGANDILLTADTVVISDGEVLGNTQYVAYIIQENTGADIFRIEAEIPYPLDHDTLVDQAAEEQDSNARPAIADHVDNMDDYDTIFLGYPNWWGDMPMILYTFLEEYDLSGKTIVPFNTHGGSGFSNTIQTIAELQPGADVLEDGFTVSRNNVAEAGSDVVSWLDEHGFTAAN